MGLGVRGGQHEGRRAFAGEPLARDQRTGAVVALDEELRLAQDTDVDACRPPGAPGIQVGRRRPDEGVSRAIGASRSLDRRAAGGMTLHASASVGGPSLLA